MKQADVVKKFLNFDYDEGNLPIKKGRVKIYNGRLTYIDSDGLEELIAFWHRGTLFHGIPNTYGDSRGLKRFKQVVVSEIIDSRIDDSSLYPLHINSFTFRDIFRDWVQFEGVWPVELRDKLVRKILQESLSSTISNIKYRMSSMLDNSDDLDKKLSRLHLDRFGFEKNHFIIETIVDKFTLDDKTLRVFKLMEKIDEKFSGLVNLVGAARMVQAAGR